MIKAYLPLVKRFRMENMSTEEWHRITRPPFTKETMNKIVSPSRGNIAVTGVSYMLVAHALEFTHNEIIEMLGAYAKECPDHAEECKALIRLITPCNLGQKEQRILQKLRQLDKDKFKLITDMIEAL